MLSGIFASGIIVIRGTCCTREKAQLSGKFKAPNIVPFSDSESVFQNDLRQCKPPNDVVRAFQGGQFTYYEDQNEERIEVNLRGEK